jgi:hypothetical protein
VAHYDLIVIGGGAGGLGATIKVHAGHLEGELLCLRRYWSLEHSSICFDAAVRFTSELPGDAVVPPDEREGEYLGSGDGVATGERLRGRLRWSL